MKKHVLLIFGIVSLLFFGSLHAQVYTAIPDANFEQALIDLDIDTDGLNGQVLTANINTITTLNIINKNIDSLDGIHAFTSLISLNCTDNKLKHIDVSNNTTLTSLNVSSNQLSTISLESNINLISLVCSSNQLDSLNVSANVSLTSLNCSRNRLKQLDVSNNILIVDLTCSSNQLDTLDIGTLDSLEVLICSHNQLKILDISHNLQLETILCADNQLDNLNVSIHDSLTFIDCSSNQISDLDMSNNDLIENITCSSNQIDSLIITEKDSLTYLSCANNHITYLDVSNNYRLLTLICSSNQLSDIDVSQDSVLSTLNMSSNLANSLDLSEILYLTSLNCSNNQLEHLEIQNGNNDTLSAFYSINNPNLYCIRVDDAVEANNKAGWFKDDIAMYDEDCFPATYVPDDNFEDALAAYDYMPDDNFIPTANIAAITKLDINNEGISVLTGIEDFTNLDTLNCSHNNLSNLNVTPLQNLRLLDCSHNDLADLVLFNGPGDLLDDMDATSNPLLTCIQVDNVTAANADTSWHKDVTASYSLSCLANKTYIPDDNFEQALIDLGYDKGSLDDYVYTHSIDTIISLKIKGKNISSLTGIPAFTALDTLDCSENKLEILDISGLTTLLMLSCYRNYLTNLDLENNTSLTKLLCGDNFMSNLDVSNNADLEHLECNSNQLKELDVSANINLTALNCNSNYITTSGLDVSNNTGLLTLLCSNNELTAIDVSQNTLLTTLDFADNQITQIDLSNNADLVKLDCSINKLNSLSLTNNIALEYVNCNSNQLQQLAFVPNTYLRNLSSEDNQLISIDITENDSLQNLSVSNNKLTVLNTTNNLFLQSLNCSGNQLSALNVSSNDSLRSLSCANNDISNLTISNLIKLNDLNCSSNMIDSLNLVSNDSITKLNCSENNILYLDLSSNNLIRVLNIDKNDIALLNTSTLDSLRELSCANNKLQELDMSNNIMLTSLNCTSNELISLDMRNGQNEHLTMFFAADNPELTCIEIDDTNQTGTNWQKDSSAMYNLNCHYNETFIPDNAFELALINLGCDIGPVDNYVPTSAVDTVQALNISNSTINNLTGLEDFTDLTVLNCSGNDLDSMDVSENTALISLNCSGNNLSSLDLGSNSALQVLNISSNQFPDIDLSNLTNLTTLNCSLNQLTALDLSTFSSLTGINFSSNLLITLNIQNGNNGAINTMNATSNPNLMCIEVDNPTTANNAPGWQKDAAASYSVDCHYFETYVPDDAFEQALITLGYDYSTGGPLDNYVPTAKIDMVSYLDIKAKGITDLTGIEDFASLTNLNCSANQLDELDISSNQFMNNLNVSSNHLTTIDISVNTNLKTLNCSNNQITELDLNSNAGLTELNCSGNLLNSLNIQQNTSLSAVYSNSNQLFSVDANNGNNTILVSFELRNNPNLRCILVDDVTMAEGKQYWLIDDVAQYSLVCDDDDYDGVPDAEDNCLTTPPNDEVDLFGCSVIRVPADNFTIRTTDETCRDANNGKINITATETHAYIATITGETVNKSYLFTNGLEIRNLMAGDYVLCIRIDDELAYNHCFDIVISQPDQLVVESDINMQDATVQLKLSGSTSYTITFNGSVFKTGESDVSLKLQTGENTLLITTNSYCQGTYEETIFLTDKLVIYPNPFNDYIHIVSEFGNSEEVLISIYSIQGQLIRSDIYPVIDGSVIVNGTFLEHGIYFMSVKWENSLSTVKIINE